MKKLLFTALIGFAMVAVTGCTTGSDANTGAKCAASGKCAADKAKDAVAKKCAAGKCAAGKCNK